MTIMTIKTVKIRIIIKILNIKSLSKNNSKVITVYQFKPVVKIIL
jgi:hypothetical protein